LEACPDYSALPDAERREMGIRLIQQIARGLERAGELAPLLMRFAKDGKALEKQIRRTLEGDGAVIRTVSVTLTSPQRRVHLVDVGDGRGAIAFLMDDVGGPPRRVDHDRANELFHKLVPMLQELRRKIRSAGDRAANWKDARATDPVAQRLARANLVRMFQDAIDDGSQIRRVAAHLVKTEDQGPTRLPSASVILRDAASKKYGRQSRSQSSK
jgi:hypothetical protein